MGNPLIDKYGEDVTLRRHASGSYVDGFWVEATPPVDTVIHANVQPLAITQLETDITQAGQKTRDGIVIYSNEQLQPSDEETATNFDEIIYNGNAYTVKSCAPRLQIRSIAHYRSTALLTNS